MPALALLAVLSAFQGAKPEAEFVAVAKSWLAMGSGAPWEDLNKLKGFSWAPAPTSLKNCLSNGDCYARQGAATVGGRKFNVVATGARTMVVTLLLRSVANPFGEQPLVAALKDGGLTVDLARCPARQGVAGTSWYRLKGDKGSAAVLSIQPSGPGRPGEGFILTQGDELPQLQPAQLAQYSEQCAPGAERKAVATGKPHEALADLTVAVLGQAGGPALYDWNALHGLATGISWFGDGPKAVDMRALGDPNPYSQTGTVTLAGRKFSVNASGTQTEVKTIHLEEQGQHPKGEHMLGVVYERGIQVRLVRCGPPYSEATLMWYNLSSAKTRPANILQHIGYDGNNVHDIYEIRLDGSLPPRDPRDRNPGTSGC